MKVELLTIEEAARFLGVSKTSLRRWTNDGRLPCVRVGPRGERRFRVEDLKAALATAGERAVEARDPGDPLEVVRAGADRGVPRHVCTHYRSRDELWRMFRPYVLHHLELGAPILYIHEPGAREDVVGRLAAEGHDAAALEARGLLRLLVPSEAYLRTGAFAAPRMIDFMESAILDRRALGHETMLISGEMTWFLSAAPGVDEMIPYEAALNQLLLRYPRVTIVCHYDVNRLPGAITLGALCSHPHAQLPDRMVPGYFRA